MPSSAVAFLNMGSSFARSADSLLRFAPVFCPRHPHVLLSFDFEKNGSRYFCFAYN
jgi:hypothetical protein